MNRTSRLATTALAALLAGAPVAVFAQSNPSNPGMTGTSPGSNMSGDNTATPHMGTGPGAPGSSTSGQSMNNPSQAQSTTPSSTSSQSYNSPTASQPGMNGGSQAQQLSQSTLEDVQQQLQHQGFYRNGKIDGRWGPETHQAVLSFQHSKGLQATGQLDQQTLDALGVHANGG
jgi:hypothetical protein